MQTDLGIRKFSSTPGGQPCDRTLEGSGESDEIDTINEERTSFDLGLISQSDSALGIDISIYNVSI